MCTIWYMITNDSIDIDAPADLVWAVYTDVERWPTWTASVRKASVVGGGDLAPGTEVDISQPRFPKLRWKVTDLDPGRGWSWTSTSPGARTVARHRVVALSPTSTRVEQSIDQGGPLGTLVGKLSRGITRRYLAMEAAGLKAASEARARQRVAH